MQKEGTVFFLTVIHSSSSKPGKEGRKQPVEYVFVEPQETRNT